MSGSRPAATFAQRVRRALERPGGTVARVGARLTPAQLKRKARILASMLVRDPGLEGRRAFRRARRSPAYQAVFDVPEPLVSVCIATYNRADLLLSRSVASVLRQSYANFELLVVGDACTDDTADRMGAVDDPRVRFVNLAQRGHYPDDPELRWMVAGTTPMNHALSLARGDFVTHLDDDDEYAPDRLEKLVALIRQERCDLVWHPFELEHDDGSWTTSWADRFVFGAVSTSTVLYHRWLRDVPWDIRAYRFRDPGDWNRFRKMLFLGVRRVRHPASLLRHFKHRNQKPA